eukprot:CAMPEP_0194130486 /NCGR_PEP_ID=MMETSP0152-20130528/1525_1 /TAXON_ID=1049557 /ORGANISM="Thalassiothrix antarctica, Strain L6-D1" /LENGTH=318 /DNA_ID=CAMNT_0038825025 /DNA_START=27 /DNA_END=983 /DNA_ORIENTATION=+
MTEKSNNNNTTGGTWRPKLVWYAVTAVALIAIVLLNSDERIVQNAEIISKNEGRTKKSIKMISILGERNSGTRWLYAHVGECFNNTLTVERHLTRYKHWFQHRNASKYKHDTLVLALYRNAFEWLEAMRKVPHHSPSHIGLKWKDFVTKEWSTPRIGTDLNITKKQMSTTICQEDFPYREIISCAVEPVPKEFYKKSRYSEHQPIYELKPDGTPYENIMEMRAAKIRNFMEIEHFPGVAGMWSIQYEYLLRNGTNELLTRIEKWTGMKRQCEAYPPQQRRKRGISIDFAKFINENLDWSAEGLIGYSQQELGKVSDTE